MALSKIPADLITGGLSVDPAAPADAITVNSSGNVGIGTSSPESAFPLTVYGSNGGVAFKTSASTSSLSQSGSDLYLDIARAGTAGNFIVRNGTSLTERLSIDSAGRVSMPYKPMFMAYPTTDYSGGSMPTGVIDMTVVYDNGSNFTAANDRFTAPIAGWYRTTWGGLQLQSTVTSLLVNGSRTYSGNHHVNTGYTTMTQTVILYLNQSDYLNIEGWNGGGYYSGWYLWTVEHIG